MDPEPRFSLNCFRADGQCETINLWDHPMSDARELARSVLQMGNGLLYTRVDIYADNGLIETVHPSALG
jgi:hypothetical protein